MSPLIHGLRWTVLVAAFGGVLIAVPGVATGRLEIPWIRVGGAPEIDVSQGPNLTPPGFDAAFYAEQRTADGSLEWRFSGRQAVAESFSEGRCLDPFLVLFDATEQPSLTLQAASAEVVAQDTAGRAWSPGGGSQIRDVKLDLAGGVTVVTGALTLEAVRGRISLLRPLKVEEGEEAPPLDPRAEVARLLLEGPIQVSGSGPGGQPVSFRAARLILIARGGSPQSPAWIEIQGAELDGSWGDGLLRSRDAMATLSQLPQTARASLGGLAGVVEPTPALAVGSGRYLLSSGALEGGVAAVWSGVSLSAERVTRAGRNWVAQGSPARVEAAGGSWLEAPRLTLSLGANPSLSASDTVRGEAVAEVASSSLPQRWSFRGDTLTVAARPAATQDGQPELDRLSLVGSPAEFASEEGSRVRANRLEVAQTSSQRSLTLRGAAEIDLSSTVAGGAALSARAERLALSLDPAPVTSGSVSGLGSTEPGMVRVLSVKRLDAFRWGQSHGQLTDLHYARVGDRGELTARGVDLSLAAVSSENAAPMQVRAETLRGRVDPARLQAGGDPLVRLAAALEQANLTGNARVGRGGDEPRALSANSIELREHVLRARGEVALIGSDTRSRWRFEAQTAVAQLAHDPAEWGQTRPLRKAARAKGIAFVPPPLLRHLELNHAVRGELTAAARTPGDPPRSVTLQGERFVYSADTRVARLQGTPLLVGGLQGRELEASELALWWTLLGEQPLAWATVRGPRLAGQPAPLLPEPESSAPSPLAQAGGQAEWCNLLFYSALPGFEFPPLAAWSAGGAEGVQVDGTGELTLRVRAPEIHGQGRRVLFPSGPLELTHGEVELRAARGSLEWRQESVLAELHGGWSSTFALPDKDGTPTPLDERYRAHGEDLLLEVDLATAARVQGGGSAVDPELAHRALRSLRAGGGIEIEGPNVKASGDAARRDPQSATTWLTGDPAQVRRGGLSYRGRKLELELR